MLALAYIRVFVNSMHLNLTIYLVFYIQLIDVQAEVLEKEKELQRAREKLAALRKEKYKHAELDDSDRMF